MYYGRRTIIRSDDLSDTQKLRKWVFSLTEHSMYGTIVSDLMSMPGFVHKLSTVKETTAGQIFINEVLFSSKDSADMYFSDEGIQALWEYVKIAAEAEGFIFVDDYRVELDSIV